MGTAPAHRAPQGRPLPLTGRPWRALAYLLARLPLPLAGVLCLVAPFAAGAWIGGVALGLLLLALYVVGAVAAAPAERRAVTLLGDDPVPDPHGEPERRTPAAIVRLRLREEATAREGAYALLRIALIPFDVAVLGAWTFGSAVLLAAPLLVTSGEVALGPWSASTSSEAWLAAASGLALLVGGAYATVALAQAHAALARALLGPRGDELHGQVTELTRSRLRLIDAFDVERRRIERDLHDGAQQRVVTLAMTLDLARIELEGSTADGEARRLVDDAHAQATQLMDELRELIREIHPPVLAELGLPAAIAALADRCPPEVASTVDVPRRLPASVETTAWFVVNEALANAIKHSGAATVEIDVRLDGDVLRASVRDAGAGGADPARGSGLAGLGDRVAAAGGRLTLSSPPGGPTVVRAELPVEAPR